MCVARTTARKVFTMNLRSALSAALTFFFVFASGAATAAPIVINFADEPIMDSGTGEITGFEWQGLGLILSTPDLSLNVGCGSSQLCVTADDATGAFNGRLVGEFVLPSTLTPTTVTNLSIALCCESGIGFFSTTIKLFDASMSLVFSSTNSDLTSFMGDVARFEIDFASDAITTISWEGAAVDSVPAPGALALLGLGLLGLGVRRRAA